MLNESGLAKSFWAEAIATANHVRNRCITRTLGKKTPYEMWTRRRPNLRYMRKFGVKVYVLDQTPNKDKFAPRGMEGIFIGYSEASKAYRVWVPSEKRVRTSRNVKFLWDFPSVELSPHLTDAIEGEVGVNNTPKQMDQQNSLPQVESIGNRQARPHEDTEIQEEHVSEESLSDASTDAGEETRRAPGRPRKVLTGRPGRPVKQYHMRSVTRKTGESSPVIDSGEEEQGCVDAEFAMSACEVPFQQAISGPDKEEWYDAVYSEIRSLIQSDTFQIVPRPTNEKIIKCRTVLRNKYDIDGNISRRKARVVAKGYAQRPGIDFFETYAPVARIGSFRLLMALAAKYDLKVSQLDVETAYLNGKIDTKIYMEKPELLREILQKIAVRESDSRTLRQARSMIRKLEGSDTVCRLNKAIYGLRQSSRRWYVELDKTLRSAGLTPTQADTCIFIDPGKQMTFVLIYVDDILIVSNDQSREKKIKEKLTQSFKIKDLGEARYCLGFEIQRKGNSIYLSQRSYVQEILNRFGMQDCKPVSTPLAPGVKLIKDSEAMINENTFPFKELLGSLMYAALGTRPDIAHALSMLGQFSSCYSRDHWVAAKRVLRYLRGTMDYRLVYRRDNLPLKGFVDADWGNCILDRRSYTGSVFILSGAAITWQSRKQRTVALSSTEAEYMGITDAAKEALHLIGFLKELECNDLTHVTIYNDNQGAKMLANNSVFHSRSKHIDIRYHFIREVLRDHTVELTYIPSERMIADVLTKALSGPRHLKCTLGLGLQMGHRAQLEGECWK